MRKLASDPLDRIEVLLLSLRSHSLHRVGQLKNESTVSIENTLSESINITKPTEGSRLLLDMRI